MKKQLLLVALGLALLGTAIAKKGQEEREPLNLLEFHSMAAVVPPFTGPANPIRNIPGAGAPWKITSAKAELNIAGNLEVSVRGLVLVSNGTNPIATFQTVLSCQSIDAVTGAPTVVNVVGGSAVASPAGDSDIEGKVALPTPCFAPMVFVSIPPAATAPPGPGRWLAVSGF
jgi:hypothetical protein